MSHYAGKIRVICEDKLCFPVNPKTLEAVACESYDPHPGLPQPGEIEAISHEEWCRRVNAARDSERRAWARRATP